MAFATTAKKAVAQCWWISAPPISIWRAGSLYVRLADLGSLLIASDPFSRPVRATRVGLPAMPPSRQNLYYGNVEENGIRSFYHGWLFRCARPLSRGWNRLTSQQKMCRHVANELLERGFSIFDFPAENSVGVRPASGRMHSTNARVTSGWRCRRPKLSCFAPGTNGRSLRR